MQVDRKSSGTQRAMGFDRLRDNLYEVLANGDFTMDFPHATYDPQRRRYTFEARFQTKPNFRIAVGGSISSTAFNMGYIGLNYRSIGRVAQSWGVDLFWGRSTRGVRGRPHRFLRMETVVPRLCVQLPHAQPQPWQFRQPDRSEQRPARQGERSLRLARAGDASDAPEFLSAANQPRRGQLPLRSRRAVGRRNRPHAVQLFRRDGRHQAQHARQGRCIRDAGRIYNFRASS